VVDLGVNVGTFATAMIDRFGCSVIGVEPAPKLFASLHAIQRLTVDPFAITAHGASAALHINSSATAATTEERLSQADAPSLVVDGITLAGLLDRHGLAHADLVKVDIEGAEISMLESATLDTLQRVDQFTVEFHDFLDAEMAFDVRRVKRRMRAAGFRALSLSRDNSDVLFVNCLRLPFDALRRAAAALVYKYPRGVSRQIARRSRPQHA
jgi:FkbM family methyltransferase